MHKKISYAACLTLKRIPEPSDIFFDSTSGHYYIVSDHGKLYECSRDYSIIRKAEKEGMDFEGVVVKDSFIYVSDETPRKIIEYRKSDLSFVKEYTVSWGGAMNKAFESISFNYAKNCFVLVSEQPATIVELTTDFIEIERHPFTKARDISGATWYKGSLYLLSDMDACIIKCDPLTYQAQAYYHINILNPEGIAFNDTGEITIVSDRAQKAYFFDSLLPITRI